MIRTIVYWGLNWGPLILGNYPSDTFEGTKNGEPQDNDVLGRHITKHQCYLY